VTQPAPDHRSGLDPDPRPAVVDPNEGAVRAAVGAVRRGDRDAFARLVDLYQRRLFSLSVMMTRDSSGAEEVTQDAFVRAFVHLDAYDIRRPFYPWLATIAVRLAQNWLTRRSRNNRREGTELRPEQDVATPAADPLSELIADENDRRLWRTVAALPYGERTAVILHYRQDMSVRDIARAMSVTSGTVKTMLFRARQRLRRTAEGGPFGKERA
jgi:RNA polymerase sigma-70 factor (ECF subfamily)